MHESQHDDKWTAELPPVQFISGGPTDIELATLTMLCRLYDINMALLSIQNKELADTVYDAHDRGESMNPQLLIPTFGEADEI